MKGLWIIGIAGVISSCSNPKVEEEPDRFAVTGEPSNRVIQSSEIEWEQLNPARGDKSPLAGTIWGDRKGTVATGFLVKFVDGFSSPPHIHNVSYRALVLKGLVHNDDAEADEMWMPVGSFWTQPAGAPHITSAKGSENIAYVEIDSGPYLVNPIEEAYDNGERPVNVDSSNIVWLDASKTNVIDREPSPSGLEVAFLWEANGFAGNMIKLPSGTGIELMTLGEVFHALVVSGELSYQLPPEDEPNPLDAGSYFGSSGNTRHSLSAKGTGPSLIYFRTNGDFEIR